MFTKNDSKGKTNAADGISSEAFEDVIGALTALLSFCEKWTRPGTRHAGGNPLAAVRLAAVAFFAGELNKAALTPGQAKRLDRAMRTALTLAADNGLDISPSPYGTLTAMSGIKLGPAADAWARATYRRSIPVDKSALFAAKQDRQREAAEAAAEAARIEEAIAEREALPSRAAELRARAEQLRREAQALGV